MPGQPLTLSNYECRAGDLAGMSCSVVMVTSLKPQALTMQPCQLGGCIAGLAHAHHAGRSLVVCQL